MSTISRNIKISFTVLLTASIKQCTPLFMDLQVRPSTKKIVVLSIIAQAKESSRPSPHHSNNQKVLYPKYSTLFKVTKVCKPSETPSFHSHLKHAYRVFVVNVEL